MFYERAKRLLDVLVALVALLVLAVPMALIGLLVVATMGAPVLFTQSRIGLGSRPFLLLKFRTMRPDTDGAWDPATDARRLTSLGRLLRHWSLDELPQFWNVLRGDMSLVGPRPLPVEYLPRYNSEQARRHTVPQGLTGWAQVNGRNATTWAERFALDLWYVEHRAWSLDLRILALTLWRVLAVKDVRHPGQDTMTEFKGNH